MTKKCMVAVLFLWVAAIHPCFAADFVVIVNRSNPVSEISKRDAQNIFLGKKTSWGNGESIVVAIQKSSGITSSFTQEIVNKSAQQFVNYWRKALFTGTGIPPKDLESDTEAKDFVASNQGAVSYISLGALDDSVRRLEIR